MINLQTITDAFASLMDYPAEAVQLWRDEMAAEGRTPLEQATIMIDEMGWRALDEDLDGLLADYFVALIMAHNNEAVRDE